jgi:DNA-binding NarL/FixJ family response regulator
MRLLIADPNEHYRARLREKLEYLSATAKVDEVSTFAAAIDRLKRTAFHVVFVSDGLPGAGHRSVAEICDTDRDIMVVVIGGDDPERLRTVLSEGALGYVRRADLDETLPAVLRTLLGGGVYIPPVESLRTKSEPLRTSGGPVPRGFFREDAMGQLTPRQREVLTMIRDEWSNTDIAETLHVTVGTVKIHITAIFKALGVRNRVQARIAAEQMGLPPIQRRPGT